MAHIMNSMTLVLLAWLPVEAETRRPWTSEEAAGQRQVCLRHLG